MFAVNCDVAPVRRQRGDHDAQRVAALKQMLSLRSLNSPRAEQQSVGGIAAVELEVVAERELRQRLEQLFF